MFQIFINIYNLPLKNAKILQIKLNKYQMLPLIKKYVSPNKRYRINFYNIQISFLLYLLCNQI